MRKKMLYALIALIALVSVGLVVTACSKGDHSPTGSDPVALTPSTPASGGTATTPAAAPATGTAGILVQLISSTFNPDRCTQLRDDQGNLTSYGKLSELVEVAKVTNNTAMLVYPKPAIFHSDVAGCGAIQSNPGGTLGLMEAENIDPGKSANWTHRFAINEDMCGSFQFDNDAMNGEIRKSTLGGGAGGKVINTGKNCPSCDLFDVQLAVTGTGLTRTVSVTFKGQKPAKKAHVDFGDGTSADLANGASVSHTWPYGEYIVKATLNADNIECYKSVTVKNEKGCEVQWIEQEPEITYGEWGECKKPTEASASSVAPACSQSRSVRTVIKEKNSCTGEVRVKSDKTTTESRPCDCKKDSCDNYTKPNITGDISSDVQTNQVVFDKGTVAPTGGNFNPTLPKTVTRPNAGDPAGSFSTTYTLSYGPAELECSVSKEFTKPVPPKVDTCDNYTPPTFGGALALTDQTDTQVTVTSGTVSPSGGTFNPNLPKTVNRPSVGSGDGSFTTTYTKSYGPEALHCSASHDYSIGIPQQVGKCYYRVSCGASQSVYGGVHQLNGQCDDHAQQSICEAATGGTPPTHGIWLNFVSGALHNHCQFPVRGISSDNFQLNPGQSDPTCLNKNSD